MGGIISVSDNQAARLNNDPHSATLDRAALERALREQGEDFFQHVTLHCPHLFAAAAYFVTEAQHAQMRAVIAAVERVVALPAWREQALRRTTLPADHQPRARGVCMGYDFHLNADGAHLIEINTNAGGVWLNALLLDSQQGAQLPGAALAQAGLEQVFLDMFYEEWRLERGDAPLRTVAIVDVQPQQQYLYPEFILAQRMFERAGITALIADPSELEMRNTGLYCRDLKIDLVYNRLTDFPLRQYPALREASQSNQIVLTPHPHAYAWYADKRNLVSLTDSAMLGGLEVNENDRAILQAGIPQTLTVSKVDAEHWWKERKQWFFKPASGFGSRGAYRGANLTQRVFGEIMQADYVAQRMAVPGERSVSVDSETLVLKADVRCYVYDGAVQLVAARLYQGQTTNFRTPGGGFALARVSAVNS